MTDPYDIDVAACRGRQKRVLAEMQRLRLDLVIVQKIEHVQWLAGPRFGPMFEPAAALTSEGHLTLVSPSARPEKAAADDSLVYDAKWLSTMRNDQRGGVVASAVGGAGQPARFEARSASSSRASRNIWRRGIVGGVRRHRAGLVSTAAAQGRRRAGAAEKGDRRRRARCIRLPER